VDQPSPSLDLALFRRFDFKVGFDYLKPEQAWLVLKAMAKDLQVPMHPSEAGQLQAKLARLHQLTPGDFAVMKRKSLWLKGNRPPNCSLTGSNRRLPPSLVLNRAWSDFDAGLDTIASHMNDIF
jgi:hypothetical protein